MNTYDDEYDSINITAHFPALTLLHIEVRTCSSFLLTLPSPSTLKLEWNPQPVILPPLHLRTKELSLLKMDFLTDSNNGWNSDIDCDCSIFWMLQWKDCHSKQGDDHVRAYLANHRCWNTEVSVLEFLLSKSCCNSTAQPSLTSFAGCGFYSVPPGLMYFDQKDLPQCRTNETWEFDPCDVELFHASNHAMYHHKTLEHIENLKKLIICASVLVIASNLTCDTLDKDAPILFKVNINGSRAVESFKSDKRIDELFPGNWKYIRFIYPSLLRVWYGRSNNPKQMIIDLKTGNVLIDEVMMNKMDRINYYSCKIVLIHDDLTTIAYDTFHGTLFMANAISGAVDVDIGPSYLEERMEASVSIVQNKPCIIGGIAENPLAMLCYDKSKREWKEDRRIHIQRWMHVSTVLNGILYVCGGLVSNKYSRNCILYNIRTGAIDRTFMLPCDANVGSYSNGELFTMNNEVHYVDRFGHFRIDPPGNCPYVESEDHTPVAILERCDTSSWNGGNSLSQRNILTLWISLFIMLMLLS